MASDAELAFDDLRLAMMALRPLVGKARPWLSDREHVFITLEWIEHARKNLERVAMRELERRDTHAKELLEQ